MTFRVYIHTRSLQASTLPIEPPPTLHPRHYAGHMAALRDAGAPVLTMSPYFLDHARWDEIDYVDGRRLQDHPDWTSFKDLLTPGEFWASVGGSGEW